MIENLVKNFIQIIMDNKTLFLFIGGFIAVFVLQFFIRLCAFVYYFILHIYEQLNIKKK